MDKKQVMTLAVECGVCDETLSSAEQVVSDFGDITAEILEFARRVAEAERKACAKACIDIADNGPDVLAAYACEEAILARSNAK